MKIGIVGLPLSGKTTLFKIISAFDKPSSGYANVAGYKLRDIKPILKGFHKSRIIHSFELLELERWYKGKI